MFNKGIACNYTPFLSPKSDKKEAFESFKSPVNSPVRSIKRLPPKNQPTQNNEGDCSPEFLPDRQRFDLWLTHLRKYSNSNHYVPSEEEIRGVSKDIENQKILNCDCDRMQNSGIEKDLKSDLKKILTYFCKNENIPYLQGLNEVAGPFIHFKKLQISLSEIYECFSLFVNRYMPTIFLDKQLLSLQCYFRMLKLLLKFHEPSLYLFLSKHNISPALYATPWFITHFSNKLNLEITYALWDLYIIEDDPNFIFYLGLAIMSQNKASVLAYDPFAIPEILCNLTINDMLQLGELYKLAIEFRTKTPQSFLDVFSELEIFKKNSRNDSDLKQKMEKNIQFLAQLFSVTCSSKEIIQIIQPSTEELLNKDSIQKLAIFSNNLPQLMSIQYPNHSAYGFNQLILISLNRSFKTANLPNTHIINIQDVTKSTITRVLVQLRDIWTNQSHIVLLSSNFDPKQYKKYSEEEEAERKKKDSPRTEDTKCDLDGKLSEEAQVIRLLRKLLEKKLPYVSILDGGISNLVINLKKSNYQVDIETKNVGAEKTLEVKSPSTSNSAEHETLSNSEESPFASFLNSSMKNLFSMFSPRSAKGNTRIDNSPSKSQFQSQNASIETKNI